MGAEGEDEEEREKGVLAFRPGRIRASRRSRLSAPLLVFCVVIVAGVRALSVGRQLLVSSELRRMLAEELLPEALRHRELRRAMLAACQQTCSQQGSALVHERYPSLVPGEVDELIHAHLGHRGRGPEVSGLHEVLERYSQLGWLRFNKLPVCVPPPNLPSLPEVLDPLPKLRAKLPHR